MPDESRLKHLELIQGVINRMSTNAFLLKGWSVVLIAALFALSAADSHVEFALLAIIPVIFFGTLDAFFLWHERLFRELYNEVRQKELASINFDMDLERFKRIRFYLTYWGSLFSLTLGLFYGGLILSVALVIFVMCEMPKG